MQERLKVEILEKYGSPLQYTKDCKILAEEVFQNTGEMLSTTTIRRLFGFLKSTSSPSKFTLNVLSRYVGCDSWDDFIEKTDKVAYKGTGAEKKWDNLNERALQLSEYTYNLIKEQSGIPFEAVVNREFAEQRIERFLESDHTALSFVAPGGYGKSSMLAKWFQKRWLQKSCDDVILFLNANFLINYLNNDFKLERWIQEQLGYANLNVVSHFLENPQECKGQIVIVMDALDEITYDIIKLERLFLQLTAFIANYKHSNKIKLIITSRNTTWEKFAYPILNSGDVQKDVWFDLNLEYFNVDKTNMHPLNEQEIQEVLNLTINKQSKSQLFWEELGFRLKQTVSYPYFLELFIKLYDPNSLNFLNEGIELMNDFLKKKIYYARFSDEKVDVLQGILKLQDYGRNGNGVRKNDLKNLFPIHLKSAGNYYYAYQEMLSYGIISEVLMDNRFGSYVKYVQISHQFLFEMLVVRKMINDNDGVDFELFKKIEKDFSGYECKNRLIGLIYGIAYQDGAFDALKDFFSLGDDVLSDSHLMAMVGRSFRSIEGVGKKLLTHYATQERAGVFLFEKFVDLNYLMRSYRTVVEEFMSQNKSKSIAITCSGLLLHAAIFSMDVKEAQRYYNLLLDSEPDTSCSAYSIGVRLASMMIYNHYISGDSNELLVMKLFYYREMAYSTSGDYLKSGDGEFELVVCKALLQMRAYNKILQLISDAEHNYDTHKNGILTDNFVSLLCYKLYAQFELGLPISESDVEILKYSKTKLSPARGYIVRIVYNSFMANYYFDKGDKSKTIYHLDKAIEISEHAQYDLLTAGLLEKMASFYHKCDDHQKEMICNSERDTILGSFKYCIKTDLINV